MTESMLACSVGVPGWSRSALLAVFPAIFWPSTMNPVTETVILGGESDLRAARETVLFC